MRDIALALFILGTIPFILTRPYIGLLVWSWLGYMNPHRLTWGFAYSFPWVMLIAIVTLVSLLVSKEKKAVRLTPTVVFLFLFFVWTTVTTFFAVQPASAWQEWEEFGKVFIMVLVTLMLVKDRQRMHWLIWAIAVSIGFWGLKGGVFTVLHGGNYHVYGPPRSFFSNNNDTALVLCMVLPLMRYLQLQTARKYVRRGLGLAMLLTGIAVLGTYSRGGLITLAVVSTALFLKSRGRIAVALVFLALLITAYQFMPAQWMERMDTLQNASSVETAQTRMQSWEFAANVAIHHPAMGGGFNVYQNPEAWVQYAPEGAVRRAVHSIYFRVLGEHGFPGLVLFLALLFFSWRNCGRVRRITRGSPQDKWAFDLASMLQVSLLAYMVGGAGDTSSYFDSAYQMMAVCTLLAVMVADGSGSTASVASAAAAGPRHTAALEGGKLQGLTGKS
jgi:probable O-glycosylation ligase (exosortase A-associated)